MKNIFNDFAVALSGGGARGIVHAGFLKALDEAYLVPSAISGASMGSIIGALYAAGVKPDDMISAIKLPDFFTLPSWIGLRGGLGSLEVLRKQLEHFIGSDSFDDLKIPLTISVTNLNKACNELINSGNLYDAVLASSSIPLVFKPTKIGNYYYVDGGLTLNLPVSCLKKEGRLVIGVNSNHVEELDKEFTSMKLVGERCMFIAVQNTIRDQMNDCDLLIDPPEARLYGTYEFERAAELFEIGYLSGLDEIPTIFELLGK